MFCFSGIVAEDCLYVTIQLLKNNSSNQQLFRENSLIPRLPLLLRLLSGNAADLLDDDQLNPHLDDPNRNQGEVQWTAQRVSNVHLLFQVSLVGISFMATHGLNSNVLYRSFELSFHRPVLVEI